jgi:hypothetical protein
MNHDSYAKFQICLVSISWDNQKIIQGGFVKSFSILLCGIIFLSTAASLHAGEVILYGATQKPGKLTWSSATNVPNDLLKGDYGGTFGIRFTSKRKIGYEQNISYSPRFAKPGNKAFQIDSNLVLQVPGKITPYATAGIGHIRTWGQDFSTDLSPLKIAASAFNFGKKFSFNYGGGIKVRRILGPLGFNIDLREYTVSSVRDDTLSFLQTSFGAILSW